jgi:hypothetical protein
MLIATFGQTTGWVGKTISYDDGLFSLEGFGLITAADVVAYDGQGHLEWAYAGLREWVQGLAACGPPIRTDARPRESQTRQRLPAWAIVLIVLGALVLLVPFVAAMAIPMFAHQSDLSRESAVKEGVHSIQVGVQSWAIDHGDRFPDPATVSRSGFAKYVDPWPVDPYSDQPMTQGTGPGEFSYTVAPDGTSFRLVGYGADGAVITVP